MKKLISTLALLIICTATSFSQNTEISKIFKKYASKEGVNVVDISNEMLTMFSSEKRNQKAKKKSKPNGEIKILTIDNKKLDSKTNFYKELAPKLKRKNYEELISINETNSQMVILRNRKDKKDKEFILITGGDDNTIIYFRGGLNISKLLEFANIGDLKNDLDFESIAKMISSN